MLLHQVANPVSRRASRILYVVMASVLAVNLPMIDSVRSAHAKQENVDQAQLLAETAMNAQNSSNFEFAAKQWEKLVNEHASSPLVGKAHYYAGFCYSQIGQYDKAIEQFTASFPKLSADQAILKPQANLFLGFAQYRQGQQMLDQGKKPEATKLLTSATQTFAKLLVDTPDFVDADQVCYFQGGAFEDLERLEDALKSYTKMQTYKKQTFKFEGLYAIADVSAQLGQNDKALEFYEKFRTEANAIGGNPMLDGVNFRTGRTLINLAIASENAGDSKTAADRFAQAETILSDVANLDTTGKEKDFVELTEDARFQQAYCLRRLGKFAQAAELYEKIASREESPLAAQSLAYAGRNWIDAGNTPNAIEQLNKSLVTNSEFAAESAHWLAGLLLKSDPSKALDLASQWIPKSDGKPVQVSLLMDQADAVYAIPERKKESIGLFKSLANNHPDHALAPTALYNAAFAALEFNDFDQAIELADKFESKYANNDFLPDVLEVKADAHLLNDQPGVAGKVFEQLIQGFGQHEKNTIWKLRLGLTQHLEENYQLAINQLQPLVDTFTESARKAEVLHWLGASQFQLKDYKNATASLTNSQAADDNWRRADETLLTLCRSQLALDQSELAKMTGKKLISKFPKSRLLSEVRYHLGEHAYDKKQFEEALVNFEAVYTNDRESKFAPHSLYAAAWSQLELKQFEASEKLFSDLIKNFPDHELAKSAKIGRGATRRKTGDLDSSIADLKEFLKTSPEGQPRLNALYEIGLAQVETKKWDDAIATFKQLLSESPDSPRKDRFNYELAWAHRANNDEASAMKHFNDIVDQTPDSPLAAEAHFHIGTVAYNKQDYNSAIASYEKCVNSKTSKSIREKAAYKLAWAQYKQDKFSEALASFQNQAKQFPEGSLYADCMFMIAESQYRLKNHEQAYQAYVAAKPAVDAAENIEPKIKWLTILHGAQSANKVKKYQEAINLASSLGDSDADASFKQDAWLELGNAYYGLKQNDLALENYRKASKNLGKTGARAHCMIGDLYFGDKKFEEAVDEFKLVYFGYGGPQAADDVKQWQAYAIYEAARCSFVQVEEAPDDLKPKLIAEAIKQFEYLLKNYGDDRLAPEAKKQLETLKKIAAR